MPAEIPVIFGKWEVLVGWLLGRTAKFPRRVRFSLAQRIDVLALSVFEGLIEARYTRERATILRQVNLDLEKLRLLLRLSHTQAFLDHRAFAHAIEGIDEVGRMVGGWLRTTEPV
ncbi:MAG: hypothetical protein ACI8RZ_006910 [Myxococcota bacterium]|jgi:hypothetical protein